MYLKGHIMKKIYTIYKILGTYVGDIHDSKAYWYKGTIYLI